MYCLKCGNIVSGKFCSFCGTDSGSTVSVNTAEPMSFVEFYNSKKEDRQSRFRQKKKNQVSENKLVTIQISMMRYVNGEHKITRGSQMPVEVPINAEPIIIKKAAFEKMQKYKAEYVIAVSNYFDYKLIYKNRTIVRHLPGSSQPFVLQEYKKALSILFSGYFCI